MENLSKYVSSQLNESVAKFRANEYGCGPFFGLRIQPENSRIWHDVTKIELEPESLFGEPADDGMQYCTLTFGSLYQTKQIDKKAKLKVKCSNNCGYNWMPSPELLAEIVYTFGGPEKVKFDINDPNLNGVNWDKVSGMNNFEKRIKE